MDSMIYIAFNNSKNIFEVYDGIHRLTSLKLIKEENAVHHTMAFVRMNPPHAGHGELVDKVHEVQKKNGGTHSIVLSKTHDPKKNPLTGEQKVKHLKRYAPGANIRASSKENPTLFSHAAELHKSGVTHLHVVAGSDRVAEYKKKFKELNGKPNKEGNVPFNFKKITVHSAGTRDPDAEGDTGMSGTKMREHAARDNHVRLAMFLGDPHRRFVVKERADRGQALIVGDFRDVDRRLDSDCPDANLFQRP